MERASAARSVLLRLKTQAISSPYFTIIVLFSLCLLFTRLKTGWQKSKRQNEVKAPVKKIPILPYWLPYIGHTPEFAWSFDDMLARGRDSTKDGIFGIHMMGSNHYMVLMPSLAQQFFTKREVTLSDEDFLNWIFIKYFGDGGSAKKIGSKKFRIVHRTLSSLIKEPFLTNATEKTVRSVECHTPSLISLDLEKQEAVEWERMSNVVRGEKGAEVDLFPLVMNYVALIAGDVLFGDAFLRNNPGITQDVWEFDRKFNAFLVGIPTLTPGLSKAKVAREKLKSAVSEWCHAALDSMNGKPVDGKWGDLSDISETMRLKLQALESVEADEQFMVTQILAVYWGLMVNANKVHFWMLLHIISSPKLLSTVREEIAPYARFSPETEKLELDVDSLVKSCPVFKATFFESMRFYTAGVSYKKVLQDISLTESVEDAAKLGKPIPQTYHISKGNYLVIPHAIMQKDERIWENPSEFNPYRFLVPDEKDSQKLRAETGHLHAFGGGASICKGRLFAERELLIFAAGFLATWDFAPVNGKWNIPEKSFNGTGSANPKSNVRVRMTKRV